jgi:hypothetical protein
MNNKEEAVSLSMDLGTINAPVSYFVSERKLLDFDLTDFDFKKKDVSKRCETIKEFYKQFPKLSTVMIEHQVPQNTVCYGLMYAFASAFSGSVVLVDARNKFRKLKVEYTTRNKSHKKLSVELEQKYLTEEQLAKFNTFSKKDDLADSILQFVTYYIECPP